MTAIEEVRQKMLTGPISDYSDFGFGRMVCIDKYSGRLIGFSGLKFLPELHDVDIGYRISDIDFCQNFGGKVTLLKARRSL